MPSTAVILGIPVITAIGCDNWGSGIQRNEINRLGHVHINNKMVRRSGCKPEQAVTSSRMTARGHRRPPEGAGTLRGHTPLVEMLEEADAELTGVIV